MPRYEIIGFGRETKRKRVRIYEVKDKKMQSKWLPAKV